MTLPLQGFSISGFKSFYGPMQFVGPLKKINIVVGENNSGKSNVIRYLRRVLFSQHSLQSSNFLIPEGDRPKNPMQSSEQTIHLLHEKSAFAEMLALNARQNHNSASTIDLINWFLERLFQTLNEDYVWLPGKADTLQLSNIVKAEHFLKIDRDGQRQMQALWTTLTGGTGGNFQNHWLPGVLALVSRSAYRPASVEFVPSARKVETHLTGYEEEFGPPSANAKSTIANLAKFANPTAEGYSQSLERWQRLTEFVRLLLRDKSITLEIPHTQDTILIKQHDRVLNLEDTGTGIHQAILLAAQVTTTSHPIVCIEEPESHFHPELQRQLMHYLASQADKQFFITTHSASIMDAVDAAVVSVRIENGYSVIDMPMNKAQRHEICHRLGYRPSDLMQANALIWIEGPSDRIYLNHWIGSIAPELEEGWHYSFAIYGGRLLSRFSAENNQTEDELIELLPINRFPYVIMDSDRKHHEDDINETKKRIQKEIGDAVWITEGREIENYISWELRNLALGKIHKADKLQRSLTEATKFDHPLSYLKDEKIIEKSFDKPKIAELVCKSPADLSVLDLNDRIKHLVEHIKKANRIF